VLSVSAVSYIVRKRNAVIELERVTKRFGRLEAVRDLSLRVERGELFAFLGPNGAGKTTTVKLIAGLLRPTAGVVRVSGFDVLREPVEVKRRLSYVPDQPYLYEKLTGREFLEFVGRLHQMNGAELGRGVDRLLEFFGCVEYADELTESYSHGMKQRIVLASALLTDPQVLVIDEPMVGLDPRSARQVKDTFRERARDGVTVFMCTHTLSFAEELADRIGIVDRGRLVACGTLAELRRASPQATSLEELYLELTGPEEAGEEVGAHG
jgi:ABC-2 type transport system ATP-binding protein